MVKLFCDLVDAMKVFSEKHTAKALAASNDVPILAGSGLLSSLEQALDEAQKVGYPVLLKATGGGGGMGIYLCRSDSDVEEKFNTAGSQGQAFFGNSGVSTSFQYLVLSHLDSLAMSNKTSKNRVHVIWKALLGCLYLLLALIRQSNRVGLHQSSKVCPLTSM